MKHQLSPARISIHRNRWFGRIIVLLPLVALAFLINGATLVYAVDAPVPLTPADGTIGTVVNYPPLGVPLFSWTAVEGTEEYRIQISQDIGFSGSNTKEFTTDNTEFVPRTLNELPDKFLDGVWYWRVRVEKPEASFYSSTMSFEKRWADNNAPVLASPIEGAELVFYDENAFRWDPVIGASTYLLEIAASIDGFGSPIYSKLTANTSHLPVLKLANGTYYWRVVPRDGADKEGLPSDPRSFTVNYARVPLLIEPEDNATPTFTPTFRWTAVEGASQYWLWYSTNNDFPPGETTAVTTRNTTYTPLTPLPNDVNYYWKVQALSGASVSEWSAIRTFLKQWYIKPVLLTPTNSFIHQRFPMFSWSPVPGASYYEFELDETPTFDNPYLTDKTSNPFYTPIKYDASANYSTTWYWRVTPYDKSNNPGKVSDTSSYESDVADVAPYQVSPLYYYPPNTFPPPFDTVAMNPYEDRTTALPLFIWNRMHVPFNSAEYPPGDAYGEAHRIQVGTDPNFFTIVWETDTENLSAAPTHSNPFTPVAGTDYYWRVCPLISGSCVEDSNTIPFWSQVWKARIDLSQGLAPISGAPDLLSPEDGAESGEVTPWLQWWPVQDAATYEVQISINASFTEIVDSDTVDHPIYAPTTALGQRSIGALDFYTYYWRVRAVDSGGTPGSWSTPRRFQVAAQSQWLGTRTLGAAENQLQIGADASGDVSASYDLTYLYASQAMEYWYFGFDVPGSSSDGKYALYLDIDHDDGSGGTSDPEGYDITTIAAHQPEYVIYFYQTSGNFAVGDTWIYKWAGSGWEAPKRLSEFGGSLYHSGGYLEVEVPITLISNPSEDGSYATTLLSFSSSAGSQPQDSVPSDPGIPGGNQVSRFSSVTEKMSLSAPPSNLGGLPYTYSSIPPFFWDWSVISPWAGHNVMIALDPEFSDVEAEVELKSNTPHWAQSGQFWEDDLTGDNTYYWRARPRYRVGGVYVAGAWSEGFRFERVGFIPQNLQTSVTFATPTFSWDMAEGADAYEIQIDTDPNFGSPDKKTTSQNSYTPTSTLTNGTYYWRVRIIRDGSIENEWGPVQSFTLTLPYPENLHHLPSGVPSHAPMLCWDPLIKTDGEGIPVLAAYKYRIEISQDPNFSSLYESTVTTEQPCYSPTKGYEDGEYYWRVAIMDGQNRIGDYSPAVTFTKQYPITTLHTPVPFSTVDIPTFSWEPIDGAESYQIEVSLYPTFSPVYASDKINFTTYTPKYRYADAGYYWRVAMIDSDNKTGPFNDATVIVGEGGFYTFLFLPFIIAP